MSDYNYTVEIETYDEEKMDSKIETLLFADSLGEAEKFFQEFECPDEAQLKLVEYRVVNSK